MESLWQMHTLCLKKTVHFCLFQNLVKFLPTLGFGKVAEIVCCVNIFHLTRLTSLPYLVKPRRCQLLHNVEMYYLQQTI